MSVTLDSATEEQIANYTAANQGAVEALGKVIRELSRRVPFAPFEDRVELIARKREAEAAKAELEAEFNAFMAEQGQMEPPDAETVEAVKAAAADLDEMIAQAVALTGIVRGITRLIEAYRGSAAPAPAGGGAASAEGATSAAAGRRARGRGVAGGAAVAVAPSPARPSVLRLAAQVIQPVAFVAGRGRVVAPAYHEGMLLVKLRTPAPDGLGAAAIMGGGAGRRGPGAAVMAWGIAGGGAAGRGMSVLGDFVRRGAVRRIVDLGGRRVGMPGEARMAGLAAGPPAVRRRGGGAARARRTAADPNAGVSIVELQTDDDAVRLQAACRNDPNVEYTSRVPVRYLFARKPVGGGGGGGHRAGGRAGSGGGGRRAAAQPPPASSMWNLQKIQWNEARALGTFRDAVGVSVAVLDTGIDPKHPDLDGQVKRYVFAHPDLPDVSGSRDLIGHGTHVAGTIGAELNAFGVNGICNCDLMAWKIFDDVADYDRFNDEFAYYVDPVMYRRALADCLDNGVDVINLSIGGPGEPDPQEEELFRLLIEAGTVVVAAMGNEREFGSPTSYPAAIAGVIAVGATGIDDSVAEFSNAGNHIALAAPGVAIWSALPRYRGQFGFEAIPGSDGRPREGKPMRRERNYAAWNGTSMASPHVAAAAALLIAKHRAAGNSPTPQEVKDGLMSTADKVPDMVGGFDSDFGAGRLNLLNLLS